MKDCRLVIILSLAALIILIPLNLTHAAKADSSFTFQRDLPSGRYYANFGKWFSVVENAILETENRAHALFGAYALPHYSLYLVNTDDEFNSFVGDGFPDWGGAVAIPSRSIIVLKSPGMSVNDKPLNQLAAHEYAHLLIHHLVTPNNVHSGAGVRRPPRWLDEGLAMYLSSEWSAGDFMTISQAQITGGFVPLASYDSLNLFSQSKAQVAYAQSYLAVKYLIDYYGVETVVELLAELRKGKTESQALETVLALDVAGFENELFGYIYEQFTLFGVLMGSTIFWLALAALVVIGAWKARKNKAARYAQWEEEEKLQSTDFDYGDPDNPEKIEDEDRPWE